MGQARSSPKEPHSRCRLRCGEGCRWVSLLQEAQKTGMQIRHADLEDDDDSSTPFKIPHTLVHNGVEVDKGSYGSGGGQVS